MTNKLDVEFMPLFRSWFATSTLAHQMSSRASTEAQDAVLMDIDLTPMVDAETVLLTHKPDSFDEAVCLLEVIRQNLTDAGRSDGLEVRAISTLQEWLANKTAASPNPLVEQLLGRSKA